MNTKENEMTQDQIDAAVAEELEALGPEPRNPIARAEWRLDVEALLADPIKFLGLDR